MKVFYDRDLQIELWGRDAIPALRRIYSSENTRYVVAFLSREYFASPYPLDEFHSALLRAIEQEDYLLPVAMDDSDIPPEYVRPSTIHLRADDYSPERLAQAIRQRVGPGSQQAQTISRTPSPGAKPMQLPNQVRLPKVAPSRFSAEATLDETLRYVGERFADEVPKLEDYGFRSHVRTSADQLSVLLEEGGQGKCELKLARGESVWAGSLTVAFQWPRVGTGVNGFVRPFWDAEAGTAKLRFQDMTAGGSEPLLTMEDLFQTLWNKIVTFLDQTAR